MELYKSVHIFFIMLFLSQFRLGSLAITPVVLPATAAGSKSIKVVDVNNSDAQNSNDENNKSSTTTTTETTKENCPRDSHWVNNKCQCLPCKPDTCDTNEILIIVEEIGNLTNIPGHCCPIYKCQQYKHCNLDGVIYNHNTSWTKNCRICKCYNGLDVCSDILNCSEAENIQEGKPCITDTGDVFLHGQKWSSDLCTNCTCEDGEQKCVAHYCETDGHKNVIMKHNNNNNNNEFCDSSIDECTIECPYGLRVLEEYGCKKCECGINPRILEIAKQKNISVDDVYLIVQLFSISDNNNKCSGINNKENNSSHLTISLLITVIVLLFICTVLLWLLIRNNKLKNTKMDVCKPHDLKKYISVPNCDTNLNATYKYTTEFIK